MSEKSLDKQGRWRSHIIAFRISPEENEDLNVRVSLSGLTKQDYIIRRVQEHDVVVQGSSRVHKALRNQMEEMLTELRRLANAGGTDEEFRSLLRLVVGIVGEMREEAKRSE